MKGLLSYKAEFESEGTRYHELKELQSIAKNEFSTSYAFKICTINVIYL